MTFNSQQLSPPLSTGDSHETQGKTVVIIGGGATGLSAAYRLCKSGYKVTLVEKSPVEGGLAASYDYNKSPVEKYYHFICLTDVELQDLATELGISHKVHYREAPTSNFVDGHSYPFNTPFDLLFFRPIPFFQRIRFGLQVLKSRFMTNWEVLDQISAREWLMDSIGPVAYNAVWDPLLRIKFGSSHDKISAAWVWNRIFRVSRSKTSLFACCSYGFFENGTHDLVEALLVKSLETGNLTVKTSTTVTGISIEGNKVQSVDLLGESQSLPADNVISTIPIPSLLKIAPEVGHSLAYLKGIDYLGVICVSMILKRPFSNNFWFNVNDKRVSFNGIIEMTNLNNCSPLRNASLAYVPYYISGESHRWKMSDEEIFDEVYTGMNVIDPAFSKSDIVDYFVNRDSYAQVICDTGFLKNIPPVKTPVEGLFITDSCQYYPEDRTITGSIRLGTKAASLIIKE